MKRRGTLNVRRCLALSGVPGDGTSVRDARKAMFELVERRERERGRSTADLLAGGRRTKARNEKSKQRATEHAASPPITIDRNGRVQRRRTTMPTTGRHHAWPRSRLPSFGQICADPLMAFNLLIFRRYISLSPRWPSLMILSRRLRIEFRFANVFFVSRNHLRCLWPRSDIASRARDAVLYSQNVSLNRT